MFDALSCLTSPDVDLFFTMNHCFICFHVFHRSECCPQLSLGTLFCKCLDNPHSMSFLFDFIYWLKTGCSMGCSLAWIRQGLEEGSRVEREGAGLVISSYQ
jgi:hypothetical protein